MPIREPYRTQYIDKLYEEGNIEGLQKEYNTIKIVIEKLSTNLYSALTALEKDNIEKNIEHEKEMLGNIRKYIDKLEYKDSIQQKLKDLNY